MPHNIIPCKNYFIANVKLAIDCPCPASGVDGLNEWLRSELENGFVADYALTDGEDMVEVVSSEDPEEGELFINEKTYSVCIIDPEHEEHWAKVKTSLPLSLMDEDALCIHVAPLFDISPHDWHEGDYKIVIGCLDNMGTLVI